MCNKGSEGEGAGGSGKNGETDREINRSADERVAMLEWLVAADNERVRCVSVTD